MSVIFWKGNKIELSELLEVMGKLERGIKLAHDELDELGIPEYGKRESEYSLQARIYLLSLREKSYVEKE